MSLKHVDGVNKSLCWLCLTFLRALRQSSVVRSWAMGQSGGQRAMRTLAMG